MKRQEVFETHITLKRKGVHMNRFLKTSEVANLLRVTPQTVQTWVRIGRLWAYPYPRRHLPDTTKRIIEAPDATR